MEIEFRTKLWEWQGKGAWFFVTLPVEYSDEIKLVASSVKKGFGSVKVEVAIGKTTWTTSIFPDTKSKSYLLPIKKDVRRSENIAVGDVVSMKIRIMEA